jgi:hypothetical protein
MYLGATIFRGCHGSSPDRYIHTHLLIGIMITSVSSELRSFANSNTTTFINLFGYLPAPSVYGALSTINDRAGITFLMLYPWAAVIFLIGALLS